MSADINLLLTLSAMQRFNISGGGCEGRRGGCSGGDKILHEKNDKTQIIRVDLSGGGGFLFTQLDFKCLHAVIDTCAVQHLTVNSNHNSGQKVQMKQKPIAQTAQQDTILMWLPLESDASI